MYTKSEDWLSYGAEKCVMKDFERKKKWTNKGNDKHENADSHVNNTTICLFVCVEVLRPSQPNGVMSSAVSLPNHTGQA